MRFLFLVLLLNSSFSYATVIKYIKNNTERYISLSGDTIVYDYDYHKSNNRNPELNSLSNDKFEFNDNFYDDYINKLYSCGLTIPSDYKLGITEKDISDIKSTLMTSHKGVVLKGQYTVFSGDYNNKVIVEQNGRIVNNCIAGTIDYSISSNNKYLAIATKKLQKLESLNVDKGRPLFLTEWEDIFIVEIYKLGNTFDLLAKIEVHEDQIKDVLVKDDGTVNIITESLNTNWLNPANWIIKLTGHSKHSSDIFVITASPDNIQGNKIKLFEDEDSIFVRFESQ